MLTKVLIAVMVLSGALMSASSGNASRVQVGVNRNPEAESSLPGHAPGEEVREEFHQTYPLSENGRLSLENLNGGVRIAVWDRSEVQVDAVKRAYRRERLNEAKIEVSASADGIRIKTVYPDWNQTFTDDAKGRYNNPAVVDYSLTVPRRTRLESIDLINGSLDVDGVEGDVKASSVNGRVVARGLTGVAKLSTVNGTLEATFAKLDEAKAISLGSVNGNVVLIIPSDANAIVRAGTVHGAIRNEFGLEVQHGDYVGHELYGQLGSGGPRIRLGNVNGGISIKHAQDGRPLSQATCLLPDKDKNKDKAKDDEDRDEDKEARRAERAEQIDADRIRREAQAEAQREVERAMREAQREIERAQREIQREAQREVQRELREQMRRAARGEGEGAGEGKGVGRGSGRGSGRVIVNKGLTEYESKSFAVTGSPRVNIMTFDGAISVHGWDKSEVMYKAKKHGSDEQEIKQVVIQTEQQGSAVSVIARSEESNGSASLDVYVPRKATLHVSSDDGELSLEGVSGDLTLRTGDGAIKVSNGGGQLEVNTGDGEIRITDFEGQVDARTGDGAISLEGKFTGLTARTGDGSISLSVPANSDFTIETNAEGIENAGLTVSEDLAPSKRVRRWRVGRGGNVFVLNTGDGKIVLNSR
ncbi:MAG: DUF4097 family beta strand repeat-containing protein [Pyrinomonadaceae bacterium]